MCSTHVGTVLKDADVWYNMNVIHKEMDMNRREFIRIGGSAFAIASAHTLFGAATPSKKMRLCVVGCGRSRPINKDGTGECVFDPKGGRGRGYQVMSRFAELPNCTITVVCDVDDRAL